MEKPKYRTQWFSASLEKVAGKPLPFGRQESDRVNPRRIDLDEFAERLRALYETFDEEGYDVINVVPIAAGESADVHAATAAHSDAYSGATFSITRGAVVVGKRRAGGP